MDENAQRVLALDERPLDVFNAWLVKISSRKLNLFITDASLNV